MCLKDYKLILKFQNNYKLTDKNEKKSINSKFWMGLINVLLGQYEYKLLN